MKPAPTLHLRNRAYPLALLGLGVFAQMCASKGNADATNGSDSGLDADVVVDGSCSSATDCPPPASECRGNTLVSYDHASCADHRCAWVMSERHCDACYNDECLVLAGTGGSGGSAGSSDDAGGTGGMMDRDAAPPNQPCDSTADCSLPRSYCKNSSTLVYANHAACTDHVCEFAFVEMACVCVNGGCVTLGTRGP
jgi:hypothetical protein